MTAEAGKFQAKMKITFRYDLSDAARVGELVAALTAQGFNFEAEFFPVLPVPVQEERPQELELSTELTTQEDYYEAQESLLKEVWGPNWREEDPDEWVQENL